MSLKTWIPKAPLNSYIEMLWAWEGYHPPHAKERILPSGMMEININLSEEPFRLNEPAQPLTSHLIQGPMVGGARTRYFVIDTSKAASLLAVWFKPGGALPFFNTSAAELHNRHIPLNLLWGRHADDLYHQLLEAKDSQQRFQLLEDALCQRLLSAVQRHRAIAYALSCFQAQPQRHSIASVVHEIALSPTRFIQLFREDVGMSPKLFCRVQRFQQVLNHISSTNAPS